MPQSAAEKVRLRIEHDILTFAIKPGERLDETRLASLHGVSRTPVREALRQLSASGLVEMRPHRGAVAKRLSIVEIVEMFEMMAMLEGICARLAAKRALNENLRAIRAAHEACRTLAEVDSIDAYYDANEVFHEEIYKASGNSAIMRQTILVRDRLKPFRRYQLNRVNRLKQSFDEHEQIVTAIEAGRAGDAEQLIQDHLSVQSNFIASIVNNMPRDFLDGTTKKPKSKPRPETDTSSAAHDNALPHVK